ncbi:MAG TPA: hypothetical protein VIG30_03165 [Ktedonobacterales bacterium]
MRGECVIADAQSLAGADCIVRANVAVPQLRAKALRKANLDAGAIQAVGRQRGVNGAAGIEHEDIAWPQVLTDVVKARMRDGVGRAVDHQQAALVAALAVGFGRLSGGLVRGQIEVEIGEFHG